MSDIAQHVHTFDPVAQVESLTDGLEELKRLLHGHYDELSEHKLHGYSLNPNYREYLLRDACGQMMYVTLRDGGSRKLIGYYVGYVTRCLHYQALTLSMDIIYVHPSSRGLKGGKTLMLEVEREARRRGVDPSRMGIKEAHFPVLAGLLSELGYVPFERTMVKWLGTGEEGGSDETSS